MDAELGTVATARYVTTDELLMSRPELAPGAAVGTKPVGQQPVEQVHGLHPEPRTGSATGSSDQSVGSTHTRLRARSV